MSDAVEVVRRVNAAINAGDLETFAKFVSPSVVVRDETVAVDEPSVTHGIRPLVERAVRWRELFEDFRADIDEAHELADGWVACEVRWSGRAQGVAVPQGYQVDMWRIEDGMITAGWMGLDDLDAARRIVTGG